MSTGNLTPQIDELRRQVALLRERCLSSESQVRELISRNAQSQLRVAELEKANQELMQKFRNLQAGTATSRNADDVAQLRSRYLAMIREIDDCIEKLNGRNPSEA